MLPSDFDESNIVLDKPDDMDRDQCEPLNVAVGQSGNCNVIISCWKITADEIEEIKRTGRVWLTVLGTAMPPVMLSGSTPTFNTAPGENDGESEADTEA